MTKSQSNTAFQNSNTQNTQENQNAQSSYTSAQNDVGNYEGQLANYSAQNPYVQGGQYQTSQNQGLADTAAAGSQAAAQAIESAGVRSGQNPSAGIAAAEQVSEANNRNQMADVDQATQQRLQGLSQYNSNVLNASAEPEKMEQGLTSGENSAANSTLGDETNASKTPSFWQQLGPALISGGAQVGAAFAKGCWIAARLYGGWDDRRVILLRLWLGWSFSKSWYGNLLVKLYGRYGQRIADDWMPRSKALTGLMGLVFCLAIERAEQWLATVEGRELWVRYQMLAEVSPGAVDAKVKSDRILKAMRFGDEFRLSNGPFVLPDSAFLKPGSALLSRKEVR